MKFREHRGGLEESLKTVVEVNSLAELEAHILKIWYPFGLDSVELTFTKYTPDGDSRIDWKELYLVMDSLVGVVGWSDSYF